MKNSPILDLAKKIRDQEADAMRKKEDASMAESLEVLAFIKSEFEKKFQEYLPMLQAEGIEYTAKFQDDRYHFKGSFILFSKPGRTKVKMDFRTSRMYRYEFVAYEGGIATMSYGEWDVNGFILFIADRLVSKPQKHR